MGTVSFLAKKLGYGPKGSFSRVITRIAIGGIALSIIVMLAADAIVIGFQREIKNKITSFAGNIQISKSQSTDAFEPEPMILSDSLEKVIRALPEVTFIQPFLTKPGIMKTATDAEGIVLKGVSGNFNRDAFLPTMVEGILPRYEDTVPSRQGVISKHLFDKLSLKLNDTLQVFFVQQRPTFVNLVVAGVYETNIEEVDNNFMLADIRLVQEQNGWGKELIGGYEIYLKRFEDTEPMATKIQTLTEYDEDAKSILSRYPQLFDWLSLLNVNIQVILILMALVAGINMITALLVIILERTNTIGLLKSLGGSNGMLRKVFVSNAIGLALSGIVLGNLIVLGLLLLQEKVGFLKLDKASYYVSQVPVSFNLWHIVGINVGAFLFCILAMLVPSMLISRVRPVDALRFE